MTVVAMQRLFTEGAKGCFRVIRERPLYPSLIVKWLFLFSLDT